MSSSRLTLVALTAIAPLTWGTTYIVTTEFLPEGYPLFASLMRALPAGILALAISRTLPKGTWWARAFTLGALNIAAFFPLLFFAAERLPGGVAAAVAGVQPLFVISLGMLILREATSWATIVVAAAGGIGVVMVVLAPGAQFDAAGAFAALMSVGCTAAGMVLTKRWGRPAGVSSLGYAGWQLTAGGLLLLPLTLSVEGIPESIDGKAIAGYAWLGLVGGLLAYVLWFRGLQLLPVAVPGLLVLASPIVATVLGSAVNGESFTAAQMVGMALTLGSLAAGQLLAYRAHRRAMRPHHPLPNSF